MVRYFLLFLGEDVAGFFGVLFLCPADLTAGLG
jgi:hypothetical protein